MDKKNNKNMCAITCKKKLFLRAISSLAKFNITYFYNVKGKRSE